MEDPRDTLDLSYEKQLEQLQKVRRGVADVATARKRIELQAQGLQKQADKLQGQAKAALGQGNEDLAREALSRRAALGEQLTELKTQHDQISEQEQKLVQTSQELQIRVERFRTQKETMKASYTAAEAQTKVGEAVSGISDSTRSAGATMQRAQDKIAGMQARAGAIDELLASGALDDLSHPVDDIQKELDKVSSTSQVDNELAALKAELGDGRRRRRARPRCRRPSRRATGGRRAPDGNLTQHQAGPGPDLPDAHDGVPPRPPLRARRRHPDRHRPVLRPGPGHRRRADLLPVLVQRQDRHVRHARQGGHARAGARAARRGRPPVRAGRHAQAARWPSRRPTSPTPSPRAAAPSRPSSASRRACCAASTSPRSRRCSPTSSPTWPTATSPS